MLCEVINAKKREFLCYFLIIFLLSTFSINCFGQDPIIKIVVKKQYVTDENLIKLAQYFKEMLCKENKFIIQIFGNKKSAKTFYIYNYLETAPKAAYSLYRDTGEESLDKTTIEEKK